MKRFLPLLAAAALMLVGCDNSLMDGELQTEPGNSVQLHVDTYGTSNKSMALNYATGVAGFTQGEYHDGSPITDPSRTNPANALGAPDSMFVSLGFDKPNTATQEGELILDFTTGKLLKSVTVTVTEATNVYPPDRPYPAEAADVYIGANASGPWKYIGQVSNDLNERPWPVDTLSVDGDRCARFVRLVDVTDRSLYTNNPDKRFGLGDGFDVDAVGIESDGECTVNTCIKKYWLWVGYHVVGKVYVEKFDNNQLKVTYKIFRSGWTLKKTHLEVGNSLRDIPRHRNGYPDLDEFEYKTNHSGNVTEYSYMVSFSGDPSTFVIAAHAVVANGKCWASAFAGRSLYCWWMSWVKYIVFKCDPDRTHDDNDKDSAIASDSDTRAWEDSWDGTGVLAWDPDFKGEGDQLNLEN